MEDIGVGTIADSFTVAQNLFDEGVVKETPNKIAAFLPIRMVGKECGNFYSVVFQGIAGADQFVLFVVVIVVIYIPSVVTIPVT